MTASAYREAVERVPSAHGWWSRLWPIVLMGQIIGTLSLLVAFRVGRDAGGILLASGSLGTAVAAQQLKSVTAA
ncbi:MAG: hypothetical protein JNL21_22955 [Myxococcales bacterium]|nr:hypothetical protein [Myxococcales bacterium]